MLEKLIYKVFNNTHGIKLLEELQKSLFHETPTNINNSNEYVIIDGKRQLIRDFITVLQKEELKNE